MKRRLIKAFSAKEGEVQVEESSWLVADYFDGFRCKCGECRHTCCGGWRIAVSEEEYFRIIGMDCSARLHEKIEGAFVRPDFPTKERYMLMEADWTGRCRMLDDDGMCMLQKECGETAITEVCRVYPRSYKSENGQRTACCSGSCEGVVELLLRPEPLNFREESQDTISETKSAKPEISASVDYDINGIFKKTVDILQNRSIPIPERISRIASEGVHYTIDGTNLYDSILPIIKEFCNEAPSFFDYVEEFEKRYSQESFKERFENDRRLFEAEFPDWSLWFENLICNNILYSAFPAVDIRLTPKDAIYGLSLEYTLLRVMCICHIGSIHDMLNEKTEDTHEKLKTALVDVIAEVYHVVEHTAFYYNSKILLGGKDEY